MAKIYVEIPTLESRLGYGPRPVVETEWFYYRPRPVVNREVLLQGKFITVPIFLDTEGESINAFEVKIKISNNLIFRDYLEKDSIISYWIEKPSIKENILSFSGITPGGYIGKKGLLVNLIFEAKQNGQAFIEILPSSQVLINDGLGTKAKLKTDRYEFPVVERSSLQDRFTQYTDNYPPEPFKIYLVSGSELALLPDNNKYYIVFDAKDKQSGIAYYEVAEVPICINLGLTCENPRFEKASSPYLLKDQSLRSYVYVKAVDRAGNERIEILRPQRLFLPEEILLFGFFVIMGIIIYFFIKKRNKFLCYN